MGKAKSPPEMIDPEIGGISGDIALVTAFLLHNVNFFKVERRNASSRCVDSGGA